LTCRKTFADRPARPLGSMRQTLDKALQVLQLLLEGVSVRATMRISGVNRNTILDLLVLIGEKCETMLDGRVQGVPVVDVQCDEIWGFVGMKEKTRTRHHPERADAGDAYCFTAVERGTKLVLAWHLGRRSKEDAVFFADKLADATTGRFQVTTDGLKPYATAIPDALPFADFAQLIKEYATKDDHKYSPGGVRHEHQHRPVHRQFWHRRGVASHPRRRGLRAGGDNLELLRREHARPRVRDRAGDRDPLPGRAVRHLPDEGVAGHGLPDRR
jgi:IS1 family transposase